MSLPDLSYNPVEGKTYTLFGNTGSTEYYYYTISSLADHILEEHDIQSVLEIIRKHSSKKKFLRDIVSTGRVNSLISFILNSIHHELKSFTLKTAEHLRNLPPLKRWDRRLSTTEEQYHLYMLEIELTNRLYRNPFINSDRKISLQPHCLRDLSVNCKSANNGFDYQCRFCSKACYQNMASRILKEHHIEPYIWMGASIGKTARESYQNHQSFGILGIACIPELVSGMRKCRKYSIPVVGIPLNANRCVRWFGEFHQNSVDLEELMKLVKD
jgi:hypothetical protein